MVMMRSLGILWCCYEKSESIRCCYDKSESIRCCYEKSGNIVVLI